MFFHVNIPFTQPCDSWSILTFDCDYERGPCLGNGKAGTVFYANNQMKGIEMASKSIMLRFIHMDPYLLTPFPIHKDSNKLEIIYYGTSCVDEKQLTTESVTWLKLRYRDQIIGCYELWHCIAIWGLGPIKELNKSNTIERISSNGVVTVPVIPECYWYFLEQRKRRILEIKQWMSVSDHPNIIKCHEVVETHQGRDFALLLFMEYANGESLASKIPESGLPENDNIKRYFYQILSALAHCHERGVKHLDIKPENILIHYSDANKNNRKSYENGKLIDDGTAVAKLTDIMMSRHLFKLYPPELPDYERYFKIGNGTSGYRSPELTTDKLNCHEKGDVFSLGVSLFKSLTGKLPFGESRITKRTSLYREFDAWVEDYFDPDVAELKEENILYCKFCSFTIRTCNISKVGKNLLTRLMHPILAKRLSAREALGHPWFDGVANLDGSCGGSSTSTSTSSKGCGTSELTQVEIVDTGYVPMAKDSAIVEDKPNDIDSPPLKKMKVFSSAPATASDPIRVKTMLKFEYYKHPTPLILSSLFRTRELNDAYIKTDEERVRQDPDWSVERFNNEILEKYKMIF